MSDDWFRNTTWDDAIERAFDEKLRRARMKEQYLRIQASTLARSHPEVTSINPTFPEESIYESMADQPIATEAWQTFKIELTVPESSTGISFGIVLTGRGQTWVDAVSLEDVR